MTGGKSPLCPPQFAAKLGIALAADRPGWSQILLAVRGSRTMIICFTHSSILLAG